MQNQIEMLKINCFLQMVLPLIVDVVKKILQSLDFKITEQGNGLDITFHIKKGEKEAEFYLNNLFLEIATIDRDENPLRFDENLRDFDYFLAKMVRITQSKLNVLFHFFREENADVAIENITQDAKQYERIRIWRIEQEKPTKNHHCK